MDYVALIIASAGVIVVLLVGFLVIPAISKVRHPEKHYGGPVYRVKLMSITDDIQIRPDLSHEQNLINAKREVVDEIIIQKTSSEDFYREIITGKLIPVATLRMKDNCYFYDNFNNVIFVEWIYIYSKKGEIVHTVINPLEKVSSAMLKEYIEERQNGDYKECPTFAHYLDWLFEGKNEEYDKALDKVEKSEEKKIAELLEKIDVSTKYHVKKSRDAKDNKVKPLYCTSTIPLSHDSEPTSPSASHESLKDAVNINGELDDTDTAGDEDSDTINSSSFEDESDEKYCDEVVSEEESEGIETSSETGIEPSNSNESIETADTSSEEEPEKESEKEPEVVDDSDIKIYESYEAISEEAQDNTTFEDETI